MILTIIITIIIFLFLMSIYSLCIVASKADDKMEKILDETNDIDI